MINERPPIRAKFSSKKRILTILLFFILSSSYVLWQESPVITLHNESLQNLLYKIKLNGRDICVGSIKTKSLDTIQLPFWEGRNASVTIQARDKEKIISLTTRTSFIGGVDIYIDPSLRISLEQTPPGFIVQEEEIK